MDRKKLWLPLLLPTLCRFEFYGCIFYLYPSLYVVSKREVPSPWNLASPLSYRKKVYNYDRGEAFSNALNLSAANKDLGLEHYVIPTLSVVRRLAALAVSSVFTLRLLSQS